jgi:hypothetical protein
MFTVGQIIPLSALKGVLSALNNIEGTSYLE